VPFVASVKVLHEEPVENRNALQALIGPSHFIAADHMERLRVLCRERRLKAEQVVAETDNSQVMEGLYVKVEEAGIVRERYKYVRSGFLQTVIDSRSQWLDRPILPNGLRPGVSLF
jgi:hypothetical protein